MSTDEPRPLVVGVPRTGEYPDALDDLSGDETSPPAPASWVVPEWAELADFREPAQHCRSCGAEVLWVRTKAKGKRAPINRDGTSHFASCPQAESWRKR